MFVTIAQSSLLVLNGPFVGWIKKGGEEVDKLRGFAKEEDWL